MTDLVKRLRIRAEASDFDAGIFEEAADEIERLRDERLRSATEIMALRHLLDEFKKRLSDRTAEAMRLHKEVKVLRLYGNKDCTAMADEALAAKGGSATAERVK